MNEQVIYSKAVQLWGKDSQVDMLIEECNELTEVLVRSVVYHEIPDSPDPIITEIVDVQILLNQMRLIYGRALEEFLLAGFRDAQELPELFGCTPAKEWGDMTIPLRMVHVLLKNRRGKASDEDVVRMSIETQTYVNDLRTLIGAEESWQRIKTQKLGYVRSLIERSEQGKRGS
jgi:hypothetical protein